MFESSGPTQAIKLAASWCIGAVLVACALAYREDFLPSRTDEPPAQPSPAAASRPAAAAGQQVALQSGSRTQVQEPAPLSGPDRIVRLRAGRGGHVVTPANINGREIDVMVDTGATLVALSYDDARAAGLRVGYDDFTHSVSTANGRAKVAPVMLNKVQIGDIIVYDVPAVVSEAGAMSGTLLGMSFLGRLRKFEMSNGVLTLIE
jgi:aspartyl protease family protein